MPRVVFGAASRLADELDRAALRRGFILSTPGRVAEVRVVAHALGDRVAGLFAEAKPHVPSSSVDLAERALDAAASDVLIAVGGGSPIGLAKAIALRRSLPIAAVPTTYSGSEMTGIWGVTEDGRKQTGRDPRVAPHIVIYDAELTLGLPSDVGAASGMNAVAHAAEALYAPDATEKVRQMAEDAVRLLAASLPAVVVRPADLEARRAALRGAHLAGAALGQTSMGLHHRLCHVLGGAFGLPHALTHAVLLPHVIAFNTPAAPTAMRRLADALGAGEAASGLADLNTRLGIDTRLRDLGLRDSDLDAAAAAAVGGGYPNPKAVTIAGARSILAAAW